MTNPIGSGLIKKYYFYIKEYFRNLIPKINSIKNKIGDIISIFKDSFSKNPFIYIAIFFILSFLICDSIYKISFILFLVSLVVIANKFVNNKHEEFILTTDFSIAIKELDSLISDCIQEYMVMNGLANTTYINDKLETQIRKETTNLVTAKLSNTLFKKLSYLYNEESVYTVIAARIYIIIMNFTIQTNEKARNNEVVTEINKQNKQVSLF